MGIGSRSRQHNRFLKSIFKGAATTVITQQRSHSCPLRTPSRGRLKPTLAKLSLARMIAATVLRMWKNEEEYDPGRAGLVLRMWKNEEEYDPGRAGLSTQTRKG